MKLQTILLEASKVGRELQHSEDNLIVGGAEKAIETLNDFKSLITNPASTSHKWDGKAAIFWGHDKQGNFYLVPLAQWNKGLLLDKKGLAKEIQNTGKRKENQTDSAYRAERLKLSQSYDRLWDVFQKASEGTKGFYKGDIMFSEPQRPDKNGYYTFTPNKVTYNVNPDGLYGKMPTAQAFVTLHGKPTQLGSNQLAPVTDKEIQLMNRTPQLIVLGPQRPETGLKVNTGKIDQAINALTSDSEAIDSIINYVGPRFTTIKKVLYDYSLASGKQNGNLKFDDWLATSNLSQQQRQQIDQLRSTPAWKKFWKAYDIMRTLKYQIWQQLLATDKLGKSLGITASVGGQPGGEGFVTPTGKIINPAFRAAEPNPRFQPQN